MAHLIERASGVSSESESIQLDSAESTFFDESSEGPPSESVPYRVRLVFSPSSVKSKLDLFSLLSLISDVLVADCLKRVTGTAIYLSICHFF
jgi:hypothetical protein